MSSNANVKAMFEKMNADKHQKLNGSGDATEDGFDLPNIDEVLKKGSGGGSKKLSVERIYQKKTQHEHILLRPDTYIGSVEHVTTPMWIYDEEAEQMVLRDITYVPGLYKIFDEILVNAADNKQRDPKNMDTIKIDINPEENKIKIWNNGKGIPVVMHKTEKMYVPTMIFGHLLTSSNYDDSERKVTGGRNGYGAKLCNIFSKKFVVETQCGEFKSAFRQAWSDNMTVAGEAKILANKGEDYTCITFQPDLAKFKMEKLDKDIVDLFTRRAYDLVASGKGVKVYLNGKRLTIKTFKDYVELYTKDKTDDANQPLKIVHEASSERWEVAVTISKMGFQQVSFVNSIATTKGGRHVDYITDQIVSKLIEVIKRKEKKAGVSIKPFQVKQHLWVFINCLIENPTFDSQTKENMTLQAKSFGSKCTISEKFLNGLNKCGLVESIQMWLRAKQQVQLNQKCSATKRSKLKDVPKLDDANDAGTKQSINCTLILTEGDSAKTLAVAGLGVIGRDKYGIFPLRGKVLNVREAAAKQIMENAEINNIIKIVGLQYKEKYETRESLEKLRYGKIMIMTDQDQDGSHIKGLLINFIHHNWPNLLKHNFVEEFITPIVKVSKGKNVEKAFYSLPEFEEWKSETDNWHTYKVKYYKGLGTSTAKEAKEYFSDMARHRIPFRYAGGEDDAAIDLAFSKKKIEERKEWLTNWMEERKRRNLLGLPEIYLYGKNTKAISFNEFVNRELILFSNMDNERSIPCLVDGFKPGQRKVMFTCIKRNIIREIKVAQLAGSVGEHSAYHHGEMSLMSTIVGLAQNFVGSNNLNLLLPIGQFGTRLHGGKDSASPRYIFTQLSPLARHVFSPNDDALLKHLRDDNLRIEPEWYIPIIPMILINGAEGIGTGWSTKIPNYDVREIVNNLKRMIEGEDPLPMLPSFKNFRGTIEEIESHRYIVNGEVAILDDETIEITELPVRTWTQSYKESVLEPMVQGTDKTPAFIKDYKEYHTESTVRFVVKLSPENLMKAEQQGIHKVFKLQTSLTANSMVLFDAAGCIRRYNNVQEILKDFYDLRLSYYEKRKNYLEGMLGAESSKLNNQARFIMEKCDGTIVVENKPKKEMIQILVKRGYDPDPVKVWKDQQAKLQNGELIDGGEDEEPAEDEAAAADGGADKDKAADYNYLLGMAMWCLTKERKEELLRQRDQKAEELKILKKKTPKELWHEDLKAFMIEFEKVEKQEREDALVGTNHPSTKAVKGSKSKKALQETEPSSMGRRVVPVIDAALRAKFEAATAMAKKRKLKKEVDYDDDDNIADGDDGEVKTLAERIGGADALKATKPRKPREKKDKPAAGSPKKTKATKEWIDGEGSKSPKKGGGRTSTGSPKKGGGKKKRNPWSDSESDADSDGSDSDGDDSRAAASVIPREGGSRRAAAAKVKYTFSDDESEKFNSDDDFPVDSKPAAATSNGKAAAAGSDSDSSVPAAGGDTDSEHSSPPAAKPKPAAAKPKPAAPAAAKPKPTAAKATTKAASQSDSDDGDLVVLSSPEVKKQPKKAPTGAAGGAKKKTGPAAKKYADSDSDDFDFCNRDDDDDDEFQPKKKSTKPAAKSSSSGGEKKKAAPAKRKLQPAKKKFVDSDLSSDDGASKAAAPKKKKKGSDDEIDLSADLSDIQPRARNQRARAATKYNFDDSDDSDM